MFVQHWNFVAPQIPILWCHKKVIPGPSHRKWFSTEFRKKIIQFFFSFGKETCCTKQQKNGMGKILEAVPCHQWILGIAQAYPERTWSGTIKSWASGSVEYLLDWCIIMSKMYFLRIFLLLLFLHHHYHHHHHHYFVSNLVGNIGLHNTDVYSS